MAKVIQVEPTPNPLAFKVILDQTVATGNGRHFAKKEDAFDSPVAQRLLSIHGVQSVFFMNNFIAINKTPGGIWDYIFFQLNEILMSVKDLTPVRGEGDDAGFKQLTPEEFDHLATLQKLEYINRIIDQTIRPGLARDGGGLELLGLEDNVLRVKYQGACGSCPSSTTATLSYISNMLQTRVSPNLTVVPA